MLIHLVFSVLTHIRLSKVFTFTFVTFTACSSKVSAEKKITALDNMLTIFEEPRCKIDCFWAIQKFGLVHKPLYNELIVQ